MRANRYRRKWRSGWWTESVFDIQSDYAGDPRQFYFGTKRQYAIQTQSTMNQKSYARLVVGDNDQLMDDRELERVRRFDRNRDEADKDVTLEGLSTVQWLQRRFGLCPWICGRRSGWNWWGQRLLWIANGKIGERGCCWRHFGCTAACA